MAAPKVIEDLVEKFKQDPQRYKSSMFNEAHTRREFIDRLFEALGWDMNNEKDDDVLYESSLKVGNTTKAPDYAFVIGDDMRFLVEAKKPCVNLADNPDPAFQLRSYAWNAKLPVSILTDFEEFAVYDCRYPPKKTDNPDTALIQRLNYTDYLTCWDWISKRFSKAAIQGGYLDDYLNKIKGRRGTKEVDAVFLDAITSWREALARNIAVRNNLTVEELNTCVQATIDRIVFLRICEDRGIERYGQLQEIAIGENVYEGLCTLFKYADRRYNSGLFHFKEENDRDYPDLLALELKIDDKVLKDIIGSLYPPNPYNFAIISPEILGEVYEQFLGKVIRLTDGGHRAKVEDKPEVKKAGGVKYTPAYIVHYIVKTTLEPLLKGKTPKEVAFIRILDPACGSGSFLLVAYKYLLDWHLEWYIRNLAPVLDKGHLPTSATVKKLLPFTIEESDDENEKAKIGVKARRIKAKAEARESEASIPINKTKEGVWNLKITERKRILLNNIYGVDIDKQAVEVTKLSLLLKVLEGQNQQSVTDLEKYGRALPDLGRNIKCGNSLVGTDISQTVVWRKLQKIEQKHVNPFEWETEFPEIMQNGGFHAIIGNPPYIRIQTMKEWAPLEVEYYRQKYSSAIKGNYDIYVVFVEKSLNLLNKNGRLGFILPHKFFNAKYGEPLRFILAEGRNLLEVVHFGDQQVFDGVTTYTCLLFLSKSGTDAFHFVKVDDLNQWRSTEKATEGIIPAEKVTDSEWNFITSLSQNK